MDWLDQMDELRKEAMDGPGTVHVVHVKTHKRIDPELEEFVYVGRAFSDEVESPLGNPYKVPANAPRGATLTAYRKWLLQQMAEKDSDQRKMMRHLAEVAADGKDVALACWCYPESSCHAEIIKEYLDKMVEKLLDKRGSPSGD